MKPQAEAPGMRAATLVREAEMADDDESLVIPPRDYTDIANLQKASVLEEFLEHPLTASLEAITAAFANGGKGLIVSAGRIAQGLVKGQVYEQIAWELRALREAGRLPNNLGETKHGLHTWAELMRIIDDECPDADRLEALKAAFYAVNKVGTADAEKITPFQLWQISKELRWRDRVVEGAQRARQLHRQCHGAAVGTVCVGEIRPWNH